MATDVCECEACSEEGGIRGVTCICHEALCPACGCCSYHCECSEEERMYALEPERPMEAEYAYFHESEDGDE